jgi:hypothetical protein
VIISVLKSLALGFYHLLLPKTASHAKHSTTTACKYLPPAQDCYKTVLPGHLHFKQKQLAAGALQLLQNVAPRPDIQLGNSDIQLMPNPDIQLGNSEATASHNSLGTIRSTVAPVTQGHRNPES